MAKNSKKEKEATKMESKSVYIRGILTDAFYGKRSFKKGEDAKDKYRFSIKANADDMAALVEAAEPYYEDTDEKWLPKWFTDEDAREYLNLSSNFDIKAGIKNPETGKIDDIGYLTDYINENGNINDWWTAEDAEAFNKLADILVAQFDSVIVLGKTHANGRFTLGENIADQGGLRVAYTAYQNSLNGKERKDIDGFTPEQRFYLAYANVWAGNIRDEEILSRTKTDPHSLGRWRVNATLRNLQPFFDAFNVIEGDKMFRATDERVVIW